MIRVLKFLAGTVGIFTAIVGPFYIAPPWALLMAFPLGCGAALMLFDGIWGDV